MIFSIFYKFLLLYNSILYRQYSMMSKNVIIYYLCNYSMNFNFHITFYLNFIHRQLFSY